MITGRSARIAVQRARDVQAGQLRHVEVGDDDVERRGAARTASIAARRVVHAGDDVAQALEQALHHHHHHLVVVDVEHVLAVAAMGDGQRRRPVARRAVLAERGR
jgi:hypothetical protein